MTRPGQPWLVSIAVGGVGAAVAVAAALRRRRESAAEPWDPPRPPPPAPRPGPDTEVARRAPAGASDRATAPAGRGRGRRAYRLGRGEPAGEGLRRIAIGRLDHAIDQLQAPGDDPEAVHEARKDLKKLRSALRLLRHRMGDASYRRENESARDAGRMLAGPRDAQVRLATLDALVEGGAVDAATVSGLRSRLEADLRTRGAAQVLATEPPARLAEAKGRARGWEVGGDGWDAIGPGLRRSYRRGRARMAAAIERPTVEGLHEWRKRVKDLWYHLRIIAPAWPPVIEALAEEAHVLSECLGDDHDLAVLASAARENHDAFEETAHLDRLLEETAQRRGELQKRAVAIGRRLYADDPAAFAARAREWWRAWRSMEAVEGTP